jgi:hypothetical protein
MDFEFFEGILQCEGIHNGGQHPHMIRGNAIETLSAGGKSAEDVSTTDDDADFDTQIMDVLDLAGDSLDDLRIDSEPLISHQSFTTELQ